MNPQELLRIVDSLHREKNIDTELVLQAIEAALAAATEVEVATMPRKLGAVSVVGGVKREINVYMKPAAMEALGKQAYTPIGRDRQVSDALKAYAAMVTSADTGAVRDVSRRLFNQGTENQLIPVDNWAMFAERGGVKGQVDWIPIQEVVNAIDHLRQYRQDKVMQIYEVLGISDIMRGSSKASETAAAQQIKAQFGSTRIQLKQFYIAEWITGALRIKAEIICKHFQPETIIRRSNIERTPDAQYAMQAIQLLKDEELSEYRINIEADSMAALDWAAERDAAVQFMQGLGAFISQVAPMAQQVPGAAPVLLSLLQWSVSKFRVSTQIEGVLDQAIAGLKQTMGQPKQPDPMQQAIVQEKQAGAQERAAKAKKTSVEAASEAMQLQLAQNALGIMQPQANLPPAQPQMPPPTNGMPPMQ